MTTLYKIDNYINPTTIILQINRSIKSARPTVARLKKIADQSTEYRTVCDSLSRSNILYNLLEQNHPISLISPHSQSLLSSRVVHSSLPSANKRYRTLLSPNLTLDALFALIIEVIRMQS